VVGSAEGLWASFRSKSPVSLELLLGGDRVKNRIFLLNLLRHSVELRVSKPRIGTVGIFPHSLWGSHRAPSWLWQNASESPLVFIDTGHIESVISGPVVHRIYTRLVLHEIGHLLLHWEKLKPQGYASVKPSSPDDEEEAWLFCEVIMGLALGEYAKVGRPSTIDQAWLQA
jgi:hypothetical protein